MPSLANWMDSVGGSKKLSRLSIPGTHDSASRYIDPTVHKDDKSPRLTTQTASIRGQLDSGIRFLDIRVGYTGGEFRLYHENVFLGLDFGQVRDMCKNFLTANPRETIIMSLNKETDAPFDTNPAMNFQARFQTYCNENPSLWYLGNTIPTLRTARGKIVLFRRFALDDATKTVGIDASAGFPNNKTDTITTTAATLTIQDMFSQTGTDETKEAKWTAIENLLTNASRAGSSANTLFLNFTSAAGVVDVDFPLSVANYVNPRLITYFDGHTSGRFGIIAMDFQTIELNRRIIRTNGVNV